MEDEKVKQLAETLKKQGLAASMLEATDKAKSILGVDIQKKVEPQEQAQQENNGLQQEEINRQEQNILQDLQTQDSTPDREDIANSKVPLNELMREVNVSPEQVEAQEEEKIDNINNEIGQIKEEIYEAEKNPEKIEQVKEEVEKVKGEVEEIVEEQEEESEEEEKQPEKDMFEQEKKIDLTKVFGHKN